MLVHKHRNVEFDVLNVNIVVNIDLAHAFHMTQELSKRTIELE